MCKALGYVKELNQLFNEIEKEYDIVKEKVRFHDLEQQDILHKIESDNFNASEGYKLAKALKDIRMERREAKQEEETLKKLMDSFVKDAKQKLNKSNMEIEAKDNVLNRLRDNKIYNPRIVNGEIVKKEKVKKDKKYININFIPNATICNKNSSLFGNEIMVLEEKEKYYECMVYSTCNQNYIIQEICKRNVNLNK